MTYKKFFNFPLGYLGTEQPLTELPYPEDFWSFRVEFMEKESGQRFLAYAHMQASYIYEVRQLPDLKAVGDISHVPDWNFYEGEGLAHSRKLFTAYLLKLIDEFGEVKLCSGEMTLSEYNWMDGRSAVWRHVDAEQLRNGIFKNFPWGQGMRDIGYDLLLKRSISPFPCPT